MKKTNRWPGLQVLSVDMGVFDYAVKVVIGPQQSAMAWRHWYYDITGDVSEADNSQRGFCSYRHGYCPVIWIPRKPRTCREHATLAHEALHAVSHLARWAGIPHCEDTEEVFCHALGWIVTATLVEAK